MPYQYDIDQPCGRLLGVSLKSQAETEHQCPFVCLFMIKRSIFNDLMKSTNHTCTVCPTLSSTVASLSLSRCLRGLM